LLNHYAADAFTSQQDKFIDEIITLSQKCVYFVFEIR